MNERGEVVGKGDLQAQTEQTFQNLQHALAAVGASLRDVVKTNLYVVGLKPEHVSVLREVRARYVSSEQPTASTLVGVSALVGARWPIEYEKRIAALEAEIAALKKTPRKSSLPPPAPRGSDRHSAVAVGAATQGPESAGAAFSTQINRLPVRTAKRPSTAATP